jgi:hypothetical protein
MIAPISARKSDRLTDEACVIRPSDVALLAAIWRALERCAGDEAEAAWAVWERMKSEPALLDAWLRHVEPMIDNRLELSKLAEEALRVTAGDEAAPGGRSASSSILERIPPPPYGHRLSTS